MIYTKYISIHAPREGGDHYNTLFSGAQCISIHAPREGGDVTGSEARRRPANFNPRPPRGGRHSFFCSTIRLYLFQSTPPARGATRFRAASFLDATISIHAPREGGDISLSNLRSIRPYFNPRPPRGGRLPFLRRRSSGKLHFNPRPPRGGRPTRQDASPAPRISIHAPREGGDAEILPISSTGAISIHAPREGGDLRSAVRKEEAHEISIHAPREGGDPLLYMIDDVEK